eukprot:snap_masked-scaffold_16-processed-gene-6.96-mRNA-1 protein AED:1.00 eAED:1.00 QI:0/-1/0/0/-1/1/1/0/125
MLGENHLNIKLIFVHGMQNENNKELKLSKDTTLRQFLVEISTTKGIELTQGQVRLFSMGKEIHLKNKNKKLEDCNLKVSDIWSTPILILTSQDTPEKKTKLIQAPKQSKKHPVPNSAETSCCIIC